MNDNIRSLGTLPASVATYTEDAGRWNRELTVKDGKSVTLSGSGLTDPITGFPVPSYYNFCKLTLGKGAKIVIAPGAWVRLYIDSKDRQGSRCQGKGELKAGKDSSFLQVFSVPVLDTYNFAALNAPRITAWKQCQAYQPISGPTPAATC